ncbi:MAG TPA: hypothetical protein DHV51_02340 [Opitutae bacterium]|nr:hypothetical protein [Opitutae bacterium]
MKNLPRIRPSLFGRSVLYLSKSEIRFGRFVKNAGGFSLETEQVMPLERTFLENTWLDQVRVCVPQMTSLKGTACTVIIDAAFFLTQTSQGDRRTCMQGFRALLPQADTYVFDTVQRDVRGPVTVLALKKTFLKALSQVLAQHSIGVKNWVPEALLGPDACLQLRFSKNALTVIAAPYCHNYYLSGDDLDKILRDTFIGEVRSLCVKGETAAVRKTLKAVFGDIPCVAEPSFAERGARSLQQPSSAFLDKSPMARCERNKAMMYATGACFACLCVVFGWIAHNETRLLRAANAVLQERIQRAQMHFEAQANPSPFQHDKAEQSRQWALLAQLQAFLNQHTHSWLSKLQMGSHGYAISLSFSEGQPEQAAALAQALQQTLSGQVSLTSTDSKPHCTYSFNWEP